MVGEEDDASYLSLPRQRRSKRQRCQHIWGSGTGCKPVNGAVGLLKKGDREAGKWSNDPYFFPLYEEAERLDLPVCFHTGSGTPDFSPAREFNFSRLIRIAMPVAHAFNSIIQNNLPQKFPKLRWGFIEAGASWVP